jgi:hypothetical protein
MKKITYILSTLVLGLALTSCGDSFLNKYPDGGSMLEEQFEKLPLKEKLKGSLYGMYSRLYAYGGSHSSFGERSIDMYEDIQSGDMAMKRAGYGWFKAYEEGLFYQNAGGYLWSYYYEIINLANRALIIAEPEVQKIMDAVADGSKPSDEIAAEGFYYAQLLAMRGWAYDNLLTYFCNPMDNLTTTMDVEVAVPVYTETEVKAGSLGEKLSTVEQVYDRIYEDLSNAIALMDFFEQYIQRTSKLEVNADVARIILAYSMLKHGDNSIIIAGGKNANDIALEQAKAVIDGKHFDRLRYNELTTTGFFDINATNWMWGQDVTVETTTGLASFFGQVDIHSYSYAAAGDTKEIDSKLYDEITNKVWDARVNWFRAPAMAYGYCPDGKFYCPKTKNVIELGEVDRNWLGDNVFMRIEVAYLIAAEAAWADNDPSTDPVVYLKELCDERVIEGKEAEYNTWIGSLSGSDAIKQAIIYNWRVEMWGEGYGMQTLRRLSKSVTLGSNHLSRSAAEINIAKDYLHFQCEIPSSETTYNPELVKTLSELTKSNN